MKKNIRDIIILRKEDVPNQNTIEQEIHSLNIMLQKLESSDDLFTCFELLDLNKFKVFTKTHLISRSLKSTVKKPFEFLINKN